ncbi:MAG: hypothetical protein IJZ73_02645 [Clostridia bacterium]|nr:hypothetical protein [Clostridia bacterium]
MKEIISALDNLPWVIKIIFCLPALNVIWAIYRIIKGVVESDPVKILIGILWIPLGATALWILDLVFVLAKKPLLFS